MCDTYINHNIINIINTWGIPLYFDDTCVWVRVRGLSALSSAMRDHEAEFAPRCQARGGSS